MSPSSMAQPSAIGVERDVTYDYKGKNSFVDGNSKPNRMCKTMGTVALSVLLYNSIWNVKCMDVACISAALTGRLAEPADGMDIIFMLDLMNVIW